MKANQRLGDLQALMCSSRMLFNETNDVEHKMYVCPITPTGVAEFHHCKISAEISISSDFTEGLTFLLSKIKLDKLPYFFAKFVTK